ncbi:MAG TPA: biopolymer transporter ExbD [Bdellovibrionota bacterium]|jgi:biopolymer transport protein ExbD|nr:biopolymer transporter ExbD [Bdellovibrionota bacterium]
MNFDDLEFGSDRPPQEPPELPLAPMIDIFCMIVIFLVLGGAFGAADVILPKSVTLPKSVNDEQVIVAPQVTLDNGALYADFIQQSLPIASLTNLNSAERRDFIRVLKQYSQNVPESVKTGENPVNLVADAQAPYEIVYQSVALLREAGFENTLFVSSFE